MPTTSAVIVDAVRTPGGKRNGRLAGWHPADLAGEVLRRLGERNDLDPSIVDDVIMGCVTQAGDQSANIARWAALAAGWPEQVPATTIDRQCGSSQQAMHFAAQGVLAGAYDVVVAGGVEVMSTTPMGSAAASGTPFGPKVIARYEERDSCGQRGLVNQGIGAELIADQWGFSREDLDAFALRSQQRAADARDQDRFRHELLPMKVRRWDAESATSIPSDETLSADEGIRASTADSLANLRPSFLPSGKITAGNSSQITDGASAVLIMSEEAAARSGVTPRARFHSFALAGSDPVIMLTGPIPATQRILKRSGMSIDDIDRFEVNEAFASVVLAWQHEVHADPDKVNVNGGAIALGHPLGASGTKLMATLLCELERTGGRYGLQVMCEGGGMANATIIERLG